MAKDEKNTTSIDEKIGRMIRPEALKKHEHLIWSNAMGDDVWAIFCACIKGDLETIRLLLKQHPPLLNCAYDYHTPMFFAVRDNKLETAAFLLERGANPVSSGTNDTLLEIARDRGYTEMQQLIKKALAGPSAAAPGGEVIAEAIRGRNLADVQGLLDASPELIHSVDENTNQPIHWAVMTRQPDMIDELLARGADINAKRADGARPVQLVNGDYGFRGWTKDFPVKPGEVLAHLRKRGAYVDICTAAAIGDFNRVKDLLDEDASLTNRVSDYISYYVGSGAPLKNAAGGGHIEIVKLLLDRGADPNLPEEGIAPRGHALHSAVCGGYIEIVKLLLEHGAYPNVDIESSADTLSAAIARNDQPVIELLCSHGAARNLKLLAYFGDIQTAAAVFAANPALSNDPEVLENAAGQGHDSFVRLMLHYQPDLAKRIAVGVKGQGPSDPIKSRELTEFLFQQGMNPNLPNWLRITPLHRFAQRGDTENAAVFLKYGADLYARDEKINSTPLAWAAKFGKLNMVQFLLEQGAKPNLPDDPLWATPLAWATRRGQEQIAELLKQHGAT